VLAVLTTSIHADDALIVRKPKYPAKTQRMLLSDAEIQQARENVKKYPAAKKLADQIIKEADEWAAWDDDKLVGLLPDARTPRAFAVSASGCPICGKKLLEKGGDYAWIVDPKNPLHITCPVDHVTFPNKDYPDDGWGWKNPKTGEKFWFVAYANHWTIHGKLVPGLQAMGQAYILTGDKKYAHKAAVIIHRIAQIYPGMDHTKQSRYGEMMRARGADYPGKIVNHIWECGLAGSVAEAYDDVFDSIDADQELQKETGKSGPEIRSFIDANFLEDAIEAIYSGKIRGNFGMHQRAMVFIGLTRQFGEQQKWFSDLMDNSTTNPGILGLRYALYNEVYRDGFPMETSPGYNSLWVSSIAQYGDLLAKAGQDVFALSRTRRLFDSAIDQVVARTKTPSLGDAGDIYGGVIGRGIGTYQVAYRHYKDPRYATFVATAGGAGESGFKTFDSLFDPPIESDAKELPAQPSRLLDGYGMGILNNKADDVGLSLYYGYKGGHGHFDRLGFELFANGQSMMPDLGYPDAMNDFVSGIYTWSKNTIAHNTVVVDAKRQVENVHGELNLFADGPFARVLDVSGDGTYPQCSKYRRAIVMVDVDPKQSYFVDFFTVAGGKQHDYSLHGPPGKFEMVGGEWSEPAKGTLAGEDVPLAKIYDDAKLDKNGAKSGYSGYGGSGFQHLFNVQTLKSQGDWVAQYTHEKDPHAKIRVRVLGAPDQQMLMADAHISPAKHPELLKYLIARHTGDKIESQFVGVFEPYRDEPFIKSVERDGNTIRVHHADGATDVITYDPEKEVAVVTSAGSWRASMPKPVGHVTSFDAQKNEVRVALDDDAKVDADAFVGRVVHFRNDLRRTAHPIAEAKRDGNDLVLTTRDDLIVGRANITKMDGQSLATDTALPLPIYRGATLANDSYQPLAIVEGMTGGGEGAAKAIKTAQPVTSIKPGEKVWLLDVGQNDRVELPLITTGQASQPGANSAKE
jgi:hypothetical protein